MNEAISAWFDVLEHVGRFGTVTFRTLPDGACTCTIEIRLENGRNVMHQCAADHESAFIDAYLAGVKNGFLEPFVTTEYVGEGRVITRVMDDVEKRQ